MIQAFKPSRGLSYFRRKSVKLIYALLTWRTRRMIFLSSLYGMVLGIKRPDHDHAAKLTQVLNIARDPQGIEFPIAIKSVIWYKRLSPTLEIEGRTYHLRDLANPDLAEGDLERLVGGIIAKTPEWLQYAKKSQMRYDLLCLGRHLRTGELPSA